MNPTPFAPCVVRIDQVRQDVSHELDLSPNATGVAFHSPG